MKLFFLFFASIFSFAALAQPAVEIKKKDRKKDIAILTTEGEIVVRLSDSTPLHRDNFLKLAKTRFYDSVLFHRVIKTFMVQAGDPNSKTATAGIPLGNGDPGYTIPAEIKSSLFHKKGALAAARKGDNVNPEKVSSGSQFYIVHGRSFNDRELDSIEIVRLSGRKIPADRRNYYKTFGGTPQLDGNYTVFGEVVRGMEVIEKIAQTQTSTAADRDRPLQNIRIISTKLIKRKN